MKKKGLIILIVIILISGGFYYFLYINSNNKNQDNYKAHKTSNHETVTENNIDKNSDTQNPSTENQQNEKDNTPQYSEQEIANFSTTIYSKDPARQNNIQITCNTLNGFTVKNGDTFSFCNTVGQATSDKGYQEADIYDKNGTKKKGLRWW